MEQIMQSVTNSIGFWPQPKALILPLNMMFGREKFLNGPRFAIYITN